MPPCSAPSHGSGRPRCCSCSRARGASARPLCQSPGAQCATDHVCPSPGLAPRWPGRALGQQEGAWGSLAPVPAPPPTGDALGQGSAPHGPQSRSNLKQGSGRQESPPSLLALAGNGTKGNCGQKGLPKVLLFSFKGNLKMKIPHFQLSWEFFPLPPPRAGKKPSAVSMRKEISSPLSLAFSRKEKRLEIKLAEGEAH